MAKQIVRDLRSQRREDRDERRSLGAELMNRRGLKLRNEMDDRKAEMKLMEKGTFDRYTLSLE